MIDGLTRRDTPGPLARRDVARWVGVLLMVLAAGAAWLANGLPVVHRGTVGPGAFPLLLAVVLAAAGLVLALRRGVPPGPAQLQPAPWMPLAGLLLFALTMPWLGTLPALALAGTVVARSTSGGWGKACLIGPGLAVLLHAVVLWGLGTTLPWWLP